jgi:hypothetical protein
MNNADPSPRWYAPWRRVEQPEATTDPADFGTAFGLDLSMAPADAPRPADDSAPEPGWIQRLSGRQRAGR